MNFNCLDHNTHDPIKSCVIAYGKCSLLIVWVTNYPMNSLPSPNRTIEDSLYQLYDPIRLDISSALSRLGKCTMKMVPNSHRKNQSKCS